MLPAASVTAISGGGSGHCKSVVQEKKRRGEVGNVRVVILLVGGNDISERGKNGEAEVVMSSEEVLQWMEDLVEWIAKEMPGTEVRTIDFLPRDSEGGRFAMAVRNWSSRVKKILPCHRHVCIWRIFVNEPRSWKLKAAKGNRKTAPWVEKAAEEGLPSSPVRFDLRRFLYGYDGVHLNGSGRRILTEILLWQLTDNPSQSKDISMTVFKDGKETLFKCRAFFKF